MNIVFVIIMAIWWACLFLSTPNRFEETDDA